MTPFNTLQTIIQNRRSAKPSDMNGKKIDNTLIHRLLQAADWAPTHGRTEPWRFIVYENEAKQDFCAGHANLYKTHTAPENFNQGKYDKILHQADTVSHIMLVYLKRTQNNSIPALEEIAAVAAAIQNILLAAEALSIAALWSTGGMTHHPSLKNFLALKEEDVVMGLIYLGYTDIPAKEGRRSIPLESKVSWRY